MCAEAGVFVCSPPASAVHAAGAPGRDGAGHGQLRAAVAGVGGGGGGSAARVCWRWRKQQLAAAVVPLLAQARVVGAPPPSCENHRNTTVIAFSEA